MQYHGFSKNRWTAADGTFYDTINSCIFITNLKSPQMVLRLKTALFIKLKPELSDFFRMAVLRY